MAQLGIRSEEAAIGTKMAAARTAQIRGTRANLIPVFPTRSGGLKDELRI
jgi:hypothetical protein